MISLAVPFALAVRALRPLIRIRFGQLRSYRLGHFAGETELYLCERDHRIHGRRTIDVFYHSPVVCNVQLKLMWDRVLNVCSFVRWIDFVSRQLPGAEAHVITLPRDTDSRALLPRSKTHLSFTREEEQRGQASLKRIGVRADAPFVCLHSRDAAYLDTTLPGLTNWRYHDYRDCDIDSYMTAAEELVRRGYYVVRMGAVVQKPLPYTSPFIIDYALNHRTAFLDIFLAARCRFFLSGGGAGLAEVPMIFRRPVAATNMIPLEYPPLGGHDLFILKKLWWREKNRFMTFREILSCGVSRFTRAEQYSDWGLEVINNTPQEILALAIEMDERVNGVWTTTEEENELQARFRSLFPPDHRCRWAPARIGTSFLRDHTDLLE